MLVFPIIHVSPTCNSWVAREASDGGQVKATLFSKPKPKPKPTRGSLRHRHRRAEAEVVGEIVQVALALDLDDGLVKGPLGRDHG